MEGGHSIDSRFSVLRSFYELGVRSMTLVQACHVPWAEAALADDTPSVPSLGGNGLTNWGKELVLEMNRLGMMIDVTHASKKTVLDVLQISKAPIVYSHSASMARHRFSSNVPDDILNTFKSKDGIVMINFSKDFLAPATNTNTSLDNVVEHIRYIRNVTGTAKHIGLGSNFGGQVEA